LLLQAVQKDEVFAALPGLSIDPEARRLWDRERIAALISQDLATESGWKVGDRVMLPAPRRGVRFQRSDGANALEVVIAGIFASTNKLAAGRIFVRYDYVRDLVGAESAGFGHIVARFSPSQNVDSMRARIDAAFENSAAPVKTYSYRALLRAYYATFRDISRLALVVLGISFVTMLLIAGSVLVQAQRERAREIAVMQALGVSRLRLAVLLLWEAAVMVAPAAFIGLAAAALLMRYLPAEMREVSGGDVPLHTIGVTLVLVVALSVIISLIPCRRMWRIPVAASLVRE
jgi:putative ABC transport system permease protein